MALAIEGVIADDVQFVDPIAAVRIQINYRDESKNVDITAYDYVSVTLAKDGERRYVPTSNIASHWIGLDLIKALDQLPEQDRKNYIADIEAKACAFALAASQNGGGTARGSIEL